MVAADDGSRQDCCCNSPRLTRGEINVLIAIASGMTSKRAAAVLRLSKSTIDGHVDAMRAKAGVRTRGELLAVAVAGSIIDMSGGTPRWTGRSCLSPRPAHAGPALRLSRHFSGRAISLGQGLMRKRAEVKSDRRIEGIPEGFKRTPVVGE